MIHVIYREEKIRYNAYHLVRAFFPAERIDTFQRPLKHGIRVERDDSPEPLAQADDIPELYETLRRLCGKELPWGMLTGVRPVKLAMRWIREHPEEGMTKAQRKEAFLSWFYEERRVSRDKAALAYEIAVTENRLLESLPLQEGSASLYIGIPFCPSVCRYCSFSSGSIERYASLVDPYLDVLKQEIREKKERYFAEDSYPVTIYIGGGTPTSLDSGQLAGLLDTVEDSFRVRQGRKEGAVREYTVEAGRPDSITADKLQILKDHGVTRISINPQTMNPDTLAAIGRNHTVEQIREAFGLARRMGFSNINMDLIMGLPGETPEDVRHTLEQIRRMQPDSLTVHSLAIKRASAMGMDPDRKLPAEEEEGRAVAAMIEEARAAASRMGMHPYYLYRQKQIAGNFENTGYALPGREGLYNILIMEEVQSIIACGAGATTKIVRTREEPRIVRTETVRNIEEYIRRGV